MSRTLLSFLALSLLTLPAVAQVRVEVAVPLPTIRFEAPPPLVVVRPGVQVVEDYDEEVYYVDRVYYVRRDGRWFRARDYRGRWAAVPVHAVPVAVTSLPPGHYRHAKRGHAYGHDKHDKHDKRGDHREERGHGKERGRGHGRH